MQQIYKTVHGGLLQRLNFFFLCKRVNVLYFICVEGTLYELLLRGKLYTNERKIWLSSYNIFKLGVLETRHLVC